MEMDLRSLLQSAAPVTGLVAESSINWIEQPQGALVPYIGLQLVSDSEGSTMQGPDGLRQSRVQVDCYAASYAGAARIAEAVKSVLHGHRGGGFRGVFFDGARSFREADEATSLHRISADYLTHWRADHA